MNSHHTHIQQMKEIVRASKGFDRVIVVTSSRKQALFWQDRLNKVKNQIMGENTRIYVVVEEWEAGQLLGTLNAWREVCKKEDLYALLEKGGRIAIYHTAGHGKRMAPIVASEGNDKSAIRLPGLLDLDGKKVPMRLLEAVIYQTSIFAPSRSGRLCVFWTDQIFIPSTDDVSYEGKYHVELLSIRGEAPKTREEWEKNWQSYGLVIPDGEGARLLEKQTWDEFLKLIEEGVVKEKNGKIHIAKGLGCFSVSYEFAKDRSAGFKKDLEEKRKLDTDPDLWMPLTSPQFVDEAKRKRLEGLIKRFEKDGPIFGDKDMGEGTYWWDFGQANLYHQNLLKLTADTAEGETMRRFFGEGSSPLVDSTIYNSDLAACVVVSSMLNEVHATESLIYNCIELSGFSADKEVVSDIFHPEKGKIRMRRGIFRDGKKDWDKRLLPNPYSYSELEKLMENVTHDEMEKEKRIWEKYFAAGFGKLFDELSHSVLRLKPARLDKAWGSEVWTASTHPANQTMVETGEIEIPLIHLLNHASDKILGGVIARDFRGEFPIITKFIESKENLSVQVHPSDDDAAALGECDPGKMEGWYILDAQKDAKIYLSLCKTITDLAMIDDSCLNAVDVKQGDVFLIPAGTLHAIGAGVRLFEIQESSNLTYRVWDWGRDRELQIEKAQKVCVFNRDAASLRQQPVERDGEINLLDTVYFTLSTIGSGRWETKGSFHLLTCIEGEATLEVGEKHEVLKTGDTVLVPASIDSYNLSTKGKVLNAYLRTPESIDPVIFQTYDVRALEKDLPDRVCYYLGMGYGTYLRRLKGAEPGTLWVCVGGGVRLSTERIRKPLIDGIRKSGVNVYDVGITTTPELYFSIPFLNADGGINITASHNEAAYNGLKQVIKDADGFILSINSDQMLEIKRTILESDFLYGNGEYVKIEEGLIPRYHNILVESNCRLSRPVWIHLRKNWELKPLLDTLSGIKFPESIDEEKWKEIRAKLRIPDEFDMPETAVERPLDGLKVVIDFGNGTGWRTVSVYENLGCEVVALNDVPDGNFPAHHPDPIKAKYRQELENTVVKIAASESEKEVVGFGHDEDADRVIFIRSDGRVVEGDRTLAIQAKDILSDWDCPTRKPKFIGEVKFSRVAEEFITACGGEYIMTPTGFAFIKKRMREIYKQGEDVVLAAELSGHQMSGHDENWMFDDGTLAAVKILTVIAKARRKGMTFIDLDEEVPRYPATPEINIRLPTNNLAEKEEIVNTVIKVFEEMGLEIDRTDGGIVKWQDENGWLGQALVRKSNTQPMMICRIEGRDEEAKRMIEDVFFDVLASVSTPAVDRLDLESDDYVKSRLKQ
ncbi:MAG: protein containing Alpha-D-phosphohexomutase, alpha/beta/alpha domain I [Candidatus Syntrophoarchaeum caldarius]|uniref:Protein containing Alpha-D-phosphohexomutase, alpha/beta/alpha domain I n=1 Tax=Candidatus Syntropharchaeum caldarium TaxID=1838285 RepID=A0A1F2P9L1_9EURY|nr:MAG: protein containing Alpha-D-phosphohexomutase, alpha/beta/alpha domain I [Candidatus Syntrophoarchaeum caldarius]